MAETALSSLEAGTKEEGWEEDEEEGCEMLELESLVMHRDISSTSKH